MCSIFDGGADTSAVDPCFARLVTCTHFVLAAGRLLFRHSTQYFMCTTFHVYNMHTILHVYLRQRIETDLHCYEARPFVAADAASLIAYFTMWEVYCLCASEQE